MHQLSAVEPGDYASLSEFLTTYPGSVHPTAYWQRRFRQWWDDNPSYRSDSPRGWIVRADDGAVVGFQGAVPSLFRLQGEERRVFAGTTWFVSPVARGQSLALFAKLPAAYGSSLIFGTSTNAKIALLLARFGFQSRASSPSGRTFLVAADAGRAARAYLRDAFSAVPDAVAGLPLVLAQVPLRIRVRRRSGDGVRTLDRVDRAFDELWARTERLYPNTSVRTASQIDWTCFANPDHRKLLLGCYDRDRLRGYLILAASRWRGVPVLELIDLWTDEERSADVARALLGAAWREARARGDAVLVLHDYARAHRGLFARLGILFSAPEARRHYYRPPTGVDVALSVDDSYLTGLEGDWAL